MSQRIPFSGLVVRAATEERVSKDYKVLISDVEYVILSRRMFSDESKDLNRLNKEEMFRQRKERHFACST